MPTMFFTGRTTPLKRCYSRIAFLAAALLIAISGFGSLADTTPSPTKPPIVTQPVYPVSSFKLLFDRDVSEAGIDNDTLLTQPVILSRVDGVYTAPQQGAEPITTTLKALSADTAKRYDQTALRAIINDLFLYLSDEAKLVSVIVQPSPADIAADLTDKRKGRKELTLLIRIGTVGQVRTEASGDRIASEERENNPLHANIRERSPFKAGEQVRGGSLITRDALDDYLYRLNRHPGRRVDAAVSPSTVPGEITLDYLVAENKPWYVYFQLANSGTDSTDEWRQRFGFVHNQLTANDDIFSIDYTTTFFDESNVVTANYTRPLGERFEVRFNALWSEFAADQVGSTLPFTGEDTAIGAMFAHTILQDGPLFLDMVGGLEFYYTTANNPVAALDGAEGLLMGTFGFELEQQTDLASTFAFARVRGNFNQADAGEFNALGRTAPDTQFMVLQYAATTSFYLEPLLNRAAWEDISTPASSTLAHELALGMRGQWAVNNDRLIPTFQAVAGGINTVRGYEQAEVAGDSSLILTAEYRFHLPRVLPIDQPQATNYFERPFRVAPESVYGRPDWDLVLKTFVDYAVTDVSNELAFETDETLFSAGLGIELSLKNNISVRADWGVALQDAGTAEAGDNRVHFVLTLLY